MNELPHLALEESPSKPSKKKIFFVAVFSFLLLAMPVTVFLVQQQQQLSSQASQEQQVESITGISLSTQSQDVGINQEVPVDILVRSDSQRINLASVKIQFNPSVVKIKELITNTSQSGGKVFFGKYWLSKGYDNSKGEISLVSGSARPGIKTVPGGQPHLLAQVRFVTLTPGNADISIMPESSLLSNDSNNPVEAEKNSLSLTVSTGASLPRSGDASPSAQIFQNRYSEMQPSSQNPNQIVVTRPKQGEVFFYFRPVEIAWNISSEAVKSIVLFLNGEPFGMIAENLQAANNFSWTPSQSIPLVMIVPENTYTLQITTRSRDGKDNVSAESEPFGLISNPSGKTVASGNTTAKGSGDLGVNDSSRILSRWGEVLNTDDPLDLNGDLAVNYLDWYLLRKALFVKDLVY